MNRKMIVCALLASTLTMAAFEVQAGWLIGRRGRWYYYSSAPAAAPAAQSAPVPSQYRSFSYDPGVRGAPSYAPAPARTNDIPNMYQADRKIRAYAP